MTGEIPSNPVQPLVIDDQGVKRFKANAIVTYLLDSHPSETMNTIALGGYTADDRRQFAQLIGYSHNGYGELSYANDCTYEVADEGVFTPLEEAQRRIDFLENELHNLREALAEPMARLFGKHPDELKDFE